MTQVVLFHHVQGLTEGIRDFAASLGQGGHTVLTPDLFDGALPGSLEEGIALAQSIDDQKLGTRVAAALDGVNGPTVFAGISWGVMAAQRLVQTSDQAIGGLFYEACIPITGDWAFGPWPQGMPAQVHGMDDDEFFAREGDLDAAREIAAAAPGLVEVFTYPGSAHLFLDSSLPSHDAQATEQVVATSRVLLDAVR